MLHPRIQPKGSVSHAAAARDSNHMGHSLMGATASSLPDRVTREQILEAAGEPYGPALYEQLKEDDGMVSRDRLLAIAKRTDVFLTHDWGMDEDDRDNHKRVAALNEGLKARGLITWFDSEKMEGNIVKMMCDGIDNASVIIVFITKRYIDKVNGDNGNDSCQQEFLYAQRRKSNKLMVPVVMERRCRNTADWVGPVCMALGNTLYVDFADDADHERALGDIVAAVTKKVPPLMKNGAALMSKASAPKPPPGAMTPTSHVAFSVGINAVPVEKTRMKALVDVDPAELAALLRHMKLDDIAKVAEEQNVTGEMLSFAEKESDLEELGFEAPRIKLKMLLSKISTFKQTGVPLAAMKIAEAQAEAAIDIDGGGHELRQPESARSVTHASAAAPRRVPVDPTDAAGLADGYSVDCHEHPLFRDHDDNGWGCDRMRTNGGCVGGCTGFHQTTRWVRYHCELCGYDMCKPCLLQHSTGEVIKPVVIDPTDATGLAAGYNVSCHKHPVFRNHGNNGWACDLANSECGCECGCTGFYQTTDWVRYHCEICSYDMCKGCLAKYATGEAEAPDEETLNSVHVSVHPHTLHRDGNDNGWGCDGRNLEGGCRSGCTGFGQSRGWLRLRCVKCNFDLCGPCARTHQTRQ